MNANELVEMVVEGSDPADVIDEAVDLAKKNKDLLKVVVSNIKSDPFFKGVKSAPFTISDIKKLIPDLVSSVKNLDWELFDYTINDLTLNWSKVIARVKKKVPNPSSAGADLDKAFNVALKYLASPSGYKQASKSE